jgi:hypothetical protein
MKLLTAISNHGQAIGSGERPLLDLFSKLPVSREAFKEMPHTGAPRTGARGTYSAAKPAGVPLLPSILRPPWRTAEDGRQGFGGYPHSSTIGRPWLPAKARDVRFGRDIALSFIQTLKSHQDTDMRNYGNK